MLRTKKRHGREIFISDLAAETHALPMLVDTGVAGTVEGCRAVFQVATVGQGVLATVGDEVA